MLVDCEAEPDAGVPERHCGVRSLFPENVGEHVLMTIYGCIRKVYLWHIEFNASSCTFFKNQLLLLSL